MDFRSGAQIREDFLRFFEQYEHRRVHSSALVPHNDPTLLFTNAGMNQFKDVFLGQETRPFTRATSSQKSVRAGGKHNDLENVGFTRRHHTFFEMLGNFSFGDYFKRDAIRFAWELLTSPKWFAIDSARLYVTIFEGSEGVPRDTEAEQLWVEAGVPRERIFERPMKDNFWQMGETGPCGPCSEIFYDLGLEASETGPGGEALDKPFPQDDQRYMEIWNLVFMQFDRTLEPATGQATLTPLPKPSIDTGMGLERIACVLQGVVSNYQTDLFVPLIQRAAELTGVAAPPTSSTPLSSRSPSLLSSRSEAEGSASDLAPNAGAPSIAPPAMGGSTTEPQAWTGTTAALSDAKPAASLRIIADHARAATFLIADGVRPANEGRGYVLRKILRRGIRHGRLLGQDQPFLHRMVEAVTNEMKPAYPELVASQERISKTVLAEEEQFARTIVLGLREFERTTTSLSRGIKAALVRRLLDAEPKSRDLYEAAILQAQGRAEDAEVLALAQQILANGGTGEFASFSDFEHSWTKADRRKNDILTGPESFKLYDTFGLPIDFIEDLCRDAGVWFKVDEFEMTMQMQRNLARASWKGGSQKSASPVFRELTKTEFEGYTSLRVEGARILALVKDGAGVPHLNPGEEGEAVLDATSFYADSGGQVGDLGVLLGADHQTVVADVKGATKPVQGVFAHKILARQTLAVGEEVDTVVDQENRAATTRNHTGTHLLHAALREVLGTHVKQAGSLVNATRLRFDFSHYAPVAEPDLREIETIVNRQVLANTPVETMVDVPIDVAVNDYGAMALFGEKYGDRVRVVRIGQFSTELCGGTHTCATGEAGLIKLIGESSVASGIRRVEAVSGTGALAEFRRGFEVVKIAGLSGIGGAEALQARLTEGEEEIKRLRRELDAMRLKSAQAAMADAASTAVEMHGVKLLTRRVDGVDKSQMRELVDQLRGKLGSGIVVLGAASEGKVTLIAAITKDLTGRIQAGKLIAQLAPLVGGRGGGRPDLAEAGGTNTAALDSTLGKAAEIVGSML